VASSSVGADAHADHESIAGVGDERGLSLEEKTLQRTRTSTVRKVQQSIPHSYMRESPVKGNEYTEQALIRDSSHSLFIRGDIQLLFKFDDNDRLTKYSVKEIFTGP